MELSSAKRVELAVRAGHLAKTALELTSTQTSVVARLQLMAVAKQVRELEEFLKKAEVDAKA